jgi:hypothetical protein
MCACAHDGSPAKLRREQPANDTADASAHCGAADEYPCGLPMSNFTKTVVLAVLTRSRNAASCARPAWSKSLAACTLLPCTLPFFQKKRKDPSQ